MNKRNPGKVSTLGRMVKAEEAFSGKPKVSDDLTPSERVQLTLMLDRLNLLNNQLREVDLATRELVGSIVMARGRDPLKFGVNLAAGKILPVQPIITPSDGNQPGQVKALREELKEGDKGT